MKLILDPNKRIKLKDTVVSLSAWQAEGTPTEKTKYTQGFVTLWIQYMDFIRSQNTMSRQGIDHEINTH